MRWERTPVVLREPGFDFCPRLMRYKKHIHLKILGELPAIQNVTPNLVAVSFHHGDVALQFAPVGRLLLVAGHKQHGAALL